MSELHATKKPGPLPKSPRNGDRKQARQRINVEVRTGYRPHPSSIPCSDCGHIGEDRRHEYDHYLGYAADNHLDVEAVCTICHAARDNAKANQTHCINGHEFTADNTIRKPNGTRACRICRQAYDRKRRDADYWRSYRANRKAVR